MTENAWLILYSSLILIASLLGGSVPLFRRVTHQRLQFYLSISAGVMLGAAFFHVMPEAMEYSGVYFGWWMSLGVVGLFCIERFIAPHSHEVNGGGHHHHHHEKIGPEAGHELEHEHEHESVHLTDGPKEPRAAAPAVAGWMAVLGLTIHTFMNGVGLAGAVQAQMEAHEKGGILSGTILGLWLPGLAMFVAIVFHKPADALAISTVLSRKGVSRGVISLVQFGFAAMVPIGATAFCLAGEALEEGLKNQLTGAALAFSAGTFLFIALSDLLPEVQFHRHDRFWLFLALAAGVAFMGGIALFEEHGHGEHAPTLQVKPESPENGPKMDRDDDHGHGHPHKH